MAKSFPIVDHRVDVISFMFFFFCMQLQALIQNPRYKKKFILEKLLCHYLDTTRTQLRTQSEQEIPEEILALVEAGYHAYVEEEKPLEYILGFVEFFGVRFVVNQYTLIPRPETEYMITAITEHLERIS